MIRLAIVAAIAGCGTPTPRAPHTAANAPNAIVRADVERAENAERIRRHDIARTEYERAVADAHDPQSEVFARREFAETLETWGEYAEMTAQLEKLVAVAPGDAAAWNDLGLLYHNAHDDTRALAALERSKQLAPRSYKPRMSLALLHWTHHDYAGAAAEYHAMLELDLPAQVRAKIPWALQQLDQLAKAPAPTP